jgi:nucleoside-diphosphate-sugar epimerase
MANLDLHYYGSGEREQNFTAAEDVARAIAAAISLEGVSGLFNIAGGRSITMRELAELVVSTVPGTTSMVVPLGRPDPQESYRAAFDLIRARDGLRWTPSIPLEEGIRHWVAYARGER